MENHDLIEPKPMPGFQRGDIIASPLGLTPDSVALVLGHRTTDGQTRLALVPGVPPAPAPVPGMPVPGQPLQNDRAAGLTLDQPDDLAMAGLAHPVRFPIPVGVLLPVPHPWLAAGHGCLLIGILSPSARVRLARIQDLLVGRRVAAARLRDRRTGWRSRSSGSGRPGSHGAPNNTRSGGSEDRA